MPPTCQKTKNIKDAAVAFMATPAGDAFFKALFPDDNEPRNNHRRAVKYIQYVDDLGPVNKKWKDFYSKIGLSKKDYEEIKKNWNATYFARLAKKQLNAEIALMEAEVSVSDDDDDDSDDATEDSDKTVPYVPEEGGGQVLDNPKVKPSVKAETIDLITDSDSDDDKDVKTIGTSNAATQVEDVEKIEKTIAPTINYQVKPTVEKGGANFDVTEDAKEIKPAVPVPLTSGEKETIVDDATQKAKKATSTLLNDAKDIKPAVPVPLTSGEKETVNNPDDAAEEATSTLAKDAKEVKPTVPLTSVEEETVVNPNEKAKEATFTLPKDATNNGGDGDEVPEEEVSSKEMEKLKDNAAKLGHMLLVLVMAFSVSPWTVVFFYIFHLAVSL